MTTETTFEWMKYSDDMYELQTPSGSILRCSLTTDKRRFAKLFFGTAECGMGNTGWYVAEGDLDYLIGALTDIREKVFKK